MSRPASASSRPAMPPSAIAGQLPSLLELKVQSLVDKVAALEDEVLFLRRCCRTLFKNDSKITSYLYFAHGAIYGPGVPPSPVGLLQGQTGPGALYPDVSNGQIVWEINRVVT